MSKYLQTWNKYKRLKFSENCENKLYSISEMRMTITYTNNRIYIHRKYMTRNLLTFLAFGVIRFNCIENVKWMILWAIPYPTEFNKSVYPWKAVHISKGRVKGKTSSSFLWEKWWAARSAFTLLIRQGNRMAMSAGKYFRILWKA